MWPWTMWPSSKAAAVTGSSRLTLAPADQLRPDVSEDLVHQLFAEHRSMNLRPAFDEDADHVAPAELIHKVRKGHPAVPRRRQLDDLGQPDAAAACGCDHSIGADNARGLPDPKLRVDHDAKGLADAFPVEAGGELGVVGDHGVDADEDRVVLVTEAVGVQPRL